MVRSDKTVELRGHIRGVLRASPRPMSIVEVKEALREFEESRHGKEGSPGAAQGH